MTDDRWPAMHDQKPFDLAEFLADLDALPESWERDRSEAQRARRTRRLSRRTGGRR